MRELAPPDVRTELLRLKNFQRDTVEHVFNAMYHATSPRRRFLVADEVGLGKTLVARGIVARVIERLWDSVDRIDIIYICSNASIARQNINRLNVMGAKEAALPSRITLLPKFVHGLEKRKLNFISLTPQTSFSLRSSLGTAEERALLYHLLPEEWRGNGAPARNALRGDVERERFRGWLTAAEADTVDESLRGAFRRRILGDGQLGSEFAQLCDRFSHSRDRWPDEDRQFQRRVIGRLRMELATSCLKALEPDLIILDEFQRFKHLLDTEAVDGAGALARDLFSSGDARVLMLSATPYKMFTTGDEPEGDDHFRDFLQTVSFLQDDQARRDQFRAALSDYRGELLRLGTDASPAANGCKDALESELRQVMVRTERLAVTPDRNGMLVEVPPASLAIAAPDISSFLALSRVARALNRVGVVEYWKSSPYLLNFMDDYQLKEAFKAASASPKNGQAVAAATSAAGDALLRWDDVERYQKVDPQNARLRQLEQDFLDRGAWELLWMPPSLPYYQPEGAYANPGVERLTKRLIFSSWQVVPKVVSALVSYEVERRMVGSRLATHDRPNTVEAREALRPRLTFSRSEGRSANMSVLALLYPSISLAEVGDSLGERNSEGALLAPEALLARVRERVQARLLRLQPTQDAGGPVDERWYWAAPMLLDREAHPTAARVWFDQQGLAGAWRGDGVEDDASSSDDSADTAAQDAWSDHVDEARHVAVGHGSLGIQPPDLADVLARLAVASPAVAALRALSRITGGREKLSVPVLRNKAGWIAWGFRSLFNQPDVTALLDRSGNATPFWRQVVDYCIAGNLQAVMDEYAHALMEWEGVAYKPWPEAARTVALRMKQVLQLRTANVRLDDIRVEGDTVQLSDRRMRARFAARFGANQADEGAVAIRKDDVRTAFNSPFWPFVLCSTSVGQEGLDFHLYCHAVVHWNLPGNPVDLEQREGRVHRFKGHAVRKNAAQLYGSAPRASGESDPWAAIFERAEEDREPGASDLIPYWVLTAPNGAHIERHVPALPLSRDTARAEALRRTLTVYRMAFGQARQTDLVRFLQDHVAEADIPAVAERLRIDLAPKPCAEPLVASADERARMRRNGDRPPYLGPEQDHTYRARSSQTLNRPAAEALLDRFVALRGPSAANGVDRFRPLLDDFAALRRRSPQESVDVSDVQ
jgi:hypothetical protein